MKSKYLYRILFVCLILFSLVSCNDSDNVFNEWEANYVYLQKDRYWEMSADTLILAHTPNGIQGEEISLKFKVKLRVPLSQDITVHQFLYVAVFPDNLNKP